MKIVIVMPLAHLGGGAERALLHVLDHARPQGLSGHVIFFEDGPLTEKAAGGGFSTSVVRAGRLRSLPAVWRTAKDISAQVASSGARLCLAWMGKAQIYSALASTR